MSTTTSIEWCDLGCPLPTSSRVKFPGYCRFHSYWLGKWGDSYAHEFRMITVRGWSRDDWRYQLACWWERVAVAILWPVTWAFWWTFYAVAGLRRVREFPEVT